MRNNLDQAGAKLCIDAWDMLAPLFIRNAQRDYSEAINSPHIGCERNYAFPAWQLNIANERATPSASSIHSISPMFALQFTYAEELLAKDMKFFGQIHTDKHDDVTGFSCMTPLSDLTKKDGEEPGCFHFITRGFYVNLLPLANIFFSGRLPHGGTAPLSPPDEHPPSWASSQVGLSSWLGIQLWFWA